MLDDLDAEASGGALERRREPFILRQGAGQHQDFTPLPGHEVLDQRVHEHRVARDHVQQMRLALLLPEHVVARGDVEEEKVPAAGGARHLVHQRGGRIDEQVMHAFVGQPLCRLDEPGRALAPAALELELHPQRRTHEPRFLYRDLGPDVGGSQCLGEIARVGRLLGGSGGFLAF